MSQMILEYDEFCMVLLNIEVFDNMRQATCLKDEVLKFQ